MTFTESELTLLLDILDQRLALNNCYRTERLKKKIATIGLHDYFKNELMGENNNEQL